MMIGVSMRQMSSEYGEVRDAISHDWFAYLIPLGVRLVLLPNALEDPVAYARSAGVERLLLTGGDDLGPLESEGVPAPTLRDRTEAALLCWACNVRLPTFGVCRGLQSVNVHFGGGLTRDISSLTLGECHRSAQHMVELEDGTLVMVNSFHDNAVLRAQVAPELHVFACSPCGVVEGLRHDKLPITTVQWHPERLGSALTLDAALVATWLEGKCG